MAWPEVSLPTSTFMRQPPAGVGPLRIQTAQLASFAIEPMAKLAVSPEDFPFLAQMRSADDDRLGEYAEVMLRGLPWPE